jgi:hypothetical protein
LVISSRERAYAATAWGGRGGGGGTLFGGLEGNEDDDDDDVVDDVVVVLFTFRSVFMELFILIYNTTLFRV